MIGDLFKIISVLGFSATKYMLGIGLVFTYSYNFLESILLTIGGGMLGVFIFSNFSGWLLKYFKKNPKPGTEKTKVTKTRRWLVRVRGKYGLAGIAFLTPIFLTVPIGTFLAMSVSKDRQEVAVYMFLSFAFWSLFFCGSFYIFGINLQKLFEEVIFWA